MANLLRAHDVSTDESFTCVRCHAPIRAMELFFWLKSRKHTAQYVHNDLACFHPTEDTVWFEIINDPSSDYLWVRNPRHVAA